MSTELAELRRQVAELRQRVGPEMCEGMEREYRNAQARAQPLYQLRADSAPTWLSGERLDEYRRRLLEPFKQHSAPWRKVDLSPYRGDALSPIEIQVYADAATAIRSGADLRPGELREYFTSDETGRRFRRWAGDPAACWEPFKMQPRRIVGWRDRNSGWTKVG